MATYIAPATGINYGTNKPDWQKVAYDNAFSAFKGGQSLEHAISKQPKYEDATRRAYNDWLSTQRKSSAPKPAASLPMLPKELSRPTVTPPEIAAPTMPELPKLNLSADTSVTNQLNKLTSVDSLPMQQAKVAAKEYGAASGAIHSSAQAGAAQRAVQTAMTPLAREEAQRAASQEIGNWSTEVKRLNDIYSKEYVGYVSKLGINSNEKIAMLTANTSLSQSLLSSITSLMNNPEIEFGDEVKNKLTSIYNSALMNNNTILDMGFSYA